MRGKRERGPGVPEDWVRVGQGGPRPFTSWVVYGLPDESRNVWASRHQRKVAGPRRPRATGRVAAHHAEGQPIPNPWRQWWAPNRLAWWIAWVFMVGSALFILGAAISLFPETFGGQHRMSIWAESAYFAGAVLYTASIYGQVLESINADDRVSLDRETFHSGRFRWFAFEPGKLEFLTPFVLLVGSAIFNYETLFALGSTVGALPKLGLWWACLIGSVLFLVSSFLQFVEAGHRYLSWEPGDVSWWVAVLFMLGSVGFIIGALPGFPDSGFPNATGGPGSLIVKWGFLSGGVAFLAGSYLMLPELFIQLRAEDERR